MCRISRRKSVCQKLARFFDTITACTDRHTDRPITHRFPSTFPTSVLGELRHFPRIRVLPSGTLFQTRDLEYFDTAHRPSASGQFGVDSTWRRRQTRQVRSTVDDNNSSLYIVTDCWYRGRFPCMSVCPSVRK